MVDDSAKYLIHAEFVADGVIERSDVVGAVFGQTEGLLGDDLDLRDLQQASKVGRIDVEVDSEGGRSHGEITIASSLDKVETAILAASLETIDRVGPCRSEVSVTEIEDVRAAKRREVVERAKELLVEAFDESIMDSREILEEVRGSVRVEDITDYHGLPAGPRVESADAIIVVEGRSDVMTLLRYGVKNAIAVEGTNVPDAVAELSNERTVTAFLDGDRGGELILRELQQVGDVDYVAFAPEGRSVEDLARHEVMTALRNKTGIRELQEGELSPSTAENHRSTTPEDATESASTTESDGESPTESQRSDTQKAREDTAVQEDEAVDSTPSLREHVRDVLEGGPGVRFLDAELGVQTETDVDAAFDTLEDIEPVPYAMVYDGELPQRLLDVAAQRGVEHIVASATGEYVKKPVGVRVRTAGELLDRAEAA